MKVSVKTDEVVISDEHAMCMDGSLRKRLMI